MKRQIFYWSLVSALAGFLFGFDTVVDSAAEKTVQALWGLGAGVHGIAMASALYGTVLGSLLGSWPTDRFGRKQTLLWIGGLYLISAVGTAFAPEVYIFILTGPPWARGNRFSDLADWRRLQCANQKGPVACPADSLSEIRKFYLLPLTCGRKRLHNSSHKVGIENIKTCQKECWSEVLGAFEGAISLNHRAIKATPSIGYGRVGELADAIGQHQPAIRICAIGRKPRLFPRLKFI
jgi:hypothetical protein